MDRNAIVKDFKAAEHVNWELSFAARTPSMSGLIGSTISQQFHCDAFGTLRSWMESICG